MIFLDSGYIRYLTKDGTYSCHVVLLPKELVWLRSKRIFFFDNIFMLYIKNERRTSLLTHESLFQSITTRINSMQYSIQQRSLCASETQQKKRKEKRLL